MDLADLMLVGFKSHLRVETVPAEVVCLVSERGVTALSGPSIEKLASALDGTRTVGQVKEELSPDLSEGEVEQMLGRLRDAGLLDCCPRRAVDPADRQAHAYWSLAGIDAERAASALATSAVEIICTGSVDPDVVAAACRESGLTICAPGRAAALSLVLCDDYLDPALDRRNSGYLAGRRPWLLAKPFGAIPWIGPVFQPGTGPCWVDLAKRLEGNRPGEFLVRRSAGRGVSPPAASLPAGRAVGLQITVLEAVKWLAGERYEGQSCVYSLDTLRLRGEHHRVARRPQCPSCGDPGLIAAQVRKPIRTVVREIADGGGNGQRALSVAEVLERYEHLVDPVTGIVGDLRRDPDSPEFLPAYLSGRNRAMSESNFTVLRAGLRAHSGGKGVTDTEAKVGALCEAVERYSATLAGDEPRIRDSYRGLGNVAIHPDACQLFDERQFAGRAAWNAVCMPCHRVPEPFSERTVIDWTPVWSLLSGRQRLLPTALLYFSPDPVRAPVSVRADSNGNAAGTTLEDAILQGFFELVERDAVALWWYNRTRQPAVSLASFDDPWVARTPEFCRRLGRQSWVLDVTSDLGIPAMAAVSRRTDKPAEDIMFGFGAHLDPRIALRRALTELGQMLPAVVNARGNGTGYRLSDPHLMSWWATATSQNQPYLLPPRAGPGRTAASYGYQPSQKIDLDPICAIARRAGLDILVLDQTRPDIGMPAVKVVVPGMRHFWPRFAPGRLFDIPVRLGRLPRQTAYKELNPIPLYL
ncbi:MAG: TOMM precursor leader peptide-binding protein [Actinobacteria bacterium]|nr:TOMM precursor leader peptide-binding protein [Actinomycetota bacterium]